MQSCLYTRARTTHPYCTLSKQLVLFIGCILGGTGGGVDDGAILDEGVEDVAKDDDASRVKKAEMSEGGEESKAKKLPALGSSLPINQWVDAKTFSQWITTLRIDEAKRLLREQPDYDIGTIAGQLGFERTHFHRTFKAQTGQSPSEYQRDIKKNPGTD